MTPHSLSGVTGLTLKCISEHLCFKVLDGAHRNAWMADTVAPMLLLLLLMHLPHEKDGLPGKSSRRARQYAFTLSGKRGHCGYHHVFIGNTCLGVCACCDHVCLCVCASVYIMFCGRLYQGSDTTDDGSGGAHSLGWLASFIFRFSAILSRNSKVLR